MSPEFGVAAVEYKLPETGEFDFFRDEDDDEEEALQFQDEDEIADQILRPRSSFDTMTIAQPAAFQHSKNVSLTNDKEKKQSVIENQVDTQSIATSITPLWELLSGQQMNAEQMNAEQGLPGMHTPRVTWEARFDTGQQENVEEELPQVIVEEGLPGMQTPRVPWNDEFGTLPQMACAGLDPVEVEKEKNQLAMPPEAAVSSMPLESPAANSEMSIEVVQQPKVWDMDECDESAESDEMDDDESMPQRSAPGMVTPIYPVNSNLASSTTPRFDQSFEFKMPSTTFQPMIDDNQSDTEQFYDSDPADQVDTDSDSLVPDEKISGACDQMDQLFDASDQL